MAVLINGLRPPRAGARVLPGGPGRRDRGGARTATTGSGDRPPRRADGRALGARRRGPRGARADNGAGSGRRTCSAAIQARQRGRARSPRPRSALTRRAPPAGGSSTATPPATELLIEVRRASPRDPRRAELPPPLAEPRLDFRVDAATALVLRGQAGEYIQVIDVQGTPVLGLPRVPRRASSRAGLERGLDATVTRTLMGSAYPQPGPVRQVLRPRHGPARGGRPRHRRPPRHVRARLPGQVLRGPRLPRPHQLHRQLQRRARAVRDRAAQGLGGAQLLLQHRVRLATCSWSSTSRGRVPATT